MKIQKLAFAPVLAAGMLFGLPAHAVPSLQLDIAGGSYVGGSDQTVYSNGNSFSLYAYGLAGSVSLTDSFYLAMALVPQTGPASSSIGSFTYAINGGSASTVNVTSDMTYGVPPLELTLAAQGHDGGDLGQHSIYETFYKQVSFNFSSGQQSGIYNTQDDAGSGPISGSGMYYVKFDIDLGGLPASSGYGIHFDLYNTQLGKKPGDIDAKDFAPFSHDAQGMVTTPVPEPETYAMLLAGLGLMGFVARRRRLPHTA